MEKVKTIKCRAIIGAAIVIVFLLTLLCLGWGKAFAAEEINLQKDQKIVELEKSYPEIYDVLDSVTYESFSRAVESDENVYVYIGRPSCGDCQQFEPDFIDMVKQKNLDEKILYFNVNSIHQDKEVWGQFKKNYHIQYTPTIAMFKEGKLIHKVEWTPEKGISTAEVEAWVTEYVLKGGEK